MAERTRVLIAEDSPLFADALRQLVEGAADLEVCGVATDGEQAVAMAQSLEPDLITMDVRMPRLDGLQAIERIMAARPTPILVMTSDPRGETGELAVEALRRGALDLEQKPLRWPPEPAEAEALRAKMRLLASVAVVHHRSPRAQPAPARPTRRGPTSVIGVGASTGGPPALARVLSELPADFSIPIVVVQHISAGFAENLVGWLHASCELDVRLARGGERLRPGQVLVAGDGAHLLVRPGGLVHLDETDPVDGHRPSATVLLESLARAYGARAAGVVLTGMGRDGARGLKAIRDAGGATVVQDRESSAVYGMPRAASELGAAGQELPLDGIGSWLRQRALVGRSA